MIACLTKERNSFWPYLNKHRKLKKVEGLSALLVKAEIMDAESAITETKKNTQICVKEF